MGVGVGGNYDEEGAQVRLASPVNWCLLFVLIRQGLRGYSGVEPLSRVCFLFGASTAAPLAAASSTSASASASASSCPFPSLFPSPFPSPFRLMSPANGDGTQRLLTISGSPRQFLPRYDTLDGSAGECEEGEAAAVERRFWRSVIFENDLRMRMKSCSSFEIRCRLTSKE